MKPETIVPLLTRGATKCPRVLPACRPRVFPTPHPVAPRVSKGTLPEFL